MTWGAEPPGEPSSAAGGPPAPYDDDAIRPVSPPTPLLATGAAAAIVAWAVLPLATQPFHLLGWAFGSLVTIGFVTAYSAVDAKRSQSNRYTFLPAADRFRPLIALAGVVAAVAHAFYFADKVAS